MFLAMKVWLAKRKARAAREVLGGLADHYSCGTYLVGALNADFNKAEREYDEAMTWLRANDPAFPPLEKGETY